MLPACQVCCSFCDPATNKPLSHVSSVEPRPSTVHRSEARRQVHLLSICRTQEFKERNHAIARVQSPHTVKTANVVMTESMLIAPTHVSTETPHKPAVPACCPHCASKT